MKLIIKLTLISILFVLKSVIVAQETDIFVIDSYLDTENGNIIKVTFFTSDSCKSTIVFNHSEKFEVSKDYKVEHKFSLPVTKLEMKEKLIPFYIVAENKTGLKSKSEIYEIEANLMNLQQDNSSSGLFKMCCIGGTIFLFPSPSISISKDKTFWGISKEIPILSYYEGGFNYPSSYFSAEYSYYDDFYFKHLLRLNYKFIYQPEYIEFLSLGLGGATDFKGNNGISPELTIGLFDIKNTFTFYIKYRFNYFNNSSLNNNELLLGLYSSFFSFNF